MNRNAPAKSKTENPPRGGAVPPPATTGLSKGADYRHLIAEAAQSSIDDVLDGDEFAEAFSSRLSLKGEAILAWSADRDFLGDDGASNPEASFLSLNLNVLADRLERVGLSRRLFVDEDLLPLSDLAEPSPQSTTIASPVSKPAMVNAQLEKLLDSFGSLDAALQLDDDLPSSTSHSDVKALDDDFDSWLDTL